jgi:hypothetical protein
MDGDSSQDLIALRELVDRHAWAIDHRDAEVLLDVFAPTGAVEIYAVGDRATLVRSTGHDDMGAIPKALAAATTATQHMLGQAYFTVDGDSATGEVYCIANHLHPNYRDGRDYSQTMYIVYSDVYERCADTRWRMSNRKVFIDWTVFQPAGPSV